MAQIIQFQTSPEQAQDENYLKNRIKQELNLVGEFNYRWHRRSIDARRKPVKINCSFKVYDSTEQMEALSGFNGQNVQRAPEVAIIGSGPAGLFAALRCIEVGLKPVIFERGKDVRSRRRDLATLNKEGKVNGESNYCFGEGGSRCQGGYSL